MITCVIADDEPLARRKLHDLLLGVDWIRCVGEAADGLSTVRLVDTLNPDLLFLDITMPGISGLQVLERIQHQPAVIFTTASDAHAVAAFELLALDYLVKPFSADRFGRSLARVRPALSGEPPGMATGTQHDLVQERSRQALGAEPLTRVFVRGSTGLISMPLSDVERIEGYDDYSALYSHGRRYLLSRRLGDLEARLAPSNFLRIHRSHLVNVDHITAVTRLDGGRLEVTLRTGFRVTSSRTRSTALRAVLERMRG